jgi:hypothetical protein
MFTDKDYIHTYYIECECTSFDHLVRLNWFEDHNVTTIQDIDGWVYLEVKLSHYIPWYKRIWGAVKYVFGKDELTYCDTMISVNEAKRVVASLNEFTDYKEAKYKEAE